MQQFTKGDLVRVAKDLGRSMSHFTADCDAIVIGSYADQYGGKDRDSYTISIKDKGQTSWYYGSQLTLIECDRLDLLQEWERSAEDEAAQKSDLEWIFANCKEVMERPHGATVQALANCFGLTDLWGAHGEGITYYSNAITTMAMAKPFLEKGDKSGWLAHCDLMRSNAGVKPVRHE